MTKIQTPILTNRKDPYGFCWRVLGEIDGWFFCDFALHEIFDFPWCEQIQLVAYDEPGPGRTEIKIIASTNPLDFDEILIKGESEFRYMDDDTIKLFKKLAKRRRRWWVTLYYWE